MEKVKNRWPWATDSSPIVSSHLAFDVGVVVAVFGGVGRRLERRFEEQRQGDGVDVRRAEQHEERRRQRVQDDAARRRRRRALGARAQHELDDTLLGNGPRRLLGVHVACCSKHTDQMSYYITMKKGKAKDITSNQMRLSYEISISNGKNDTVARC